MTEDAPAIARARLLTSLCAYSRPVSRRPCSGCCASSSKVIATTMAHVKARTDRIVISPGWILQCACHWFGGAVGQTCTAVGNRGASRLSAGSETASLPHKKQKACAAWRRRQAVGCELSALNLFLLRCRVMGGSDRARRHFEPLDLALLRVHGQHERFFGERGGNTFPLN